MNTNDQGTVMQLPTMVVAGAQKCGTSTLATALSRHPQIFMTRQPKETHFFDRHFDRGLGWYAAQFQPAPHHRHAGEATPAYMFDTLARRRMAETLPDARIVIILRDPVKRAYSHYWHRRGLNDKFIPDTFEQAITEELEDAEQGRPRHPKRAFLARGHYIDQITKVVSGHGRHNVHVMLLDDLSTAWVPTLAELFGALDVDPGEAESIQPVWRTQQRAEYPPMTGQTRARLVESYRHDNERLSEWLGRDLSAWSAP